MKAQVADYRYIVYAVRIEAANGEVCRFVDYPHPLVIGEQTYHSNSGYEFTGVDYTSDGSPSVVDFQGIIGTAIGQLTRDSVASGTWDSARAYIFATTWSNPIEDEEPLGQFLFGKHILKDDHYTIEFMHLIDAITQSVGATYAPVCNNTLFDENLDGDRVPAHRSLCQLDINDYIVTGTVTEVVDLYSWRDANRTEPDDYFSAGSVLWTTGGNAGLRSQEIKAYTLAGTVTQFLATHYPVQVGDEYKMVPGCRKRRVPDCYGKFGNAINFMGFDMLPVKSEYSKVGMGQ